MNKEFEALDRLLAVSDESKYWNCDDYITDVNTVKQALLKAEKLEKVLKIITDKRVSIILLNACDWVEDYNQETHHLNGLAYGLPELTQQEFEFLKEVLE